MKKQINYSLGELETSIMEIMWKRDCATVRCVVDLIRQKKKIAYTTVMTVMARLVTKKLLQRHKDSTGAYVYCPCISKKAFQEGASKIAINTLLNTYGNVAIAQFIHTLDNSTNSDIKKWKQELRKIT
jgi:predicted transcriptional regulator